MNSCLAARPARDPWSMVARDRDHPSRSSQRRLCWVYVCRASLREGSSIAPSSFDRRPAIGLLQHFTMDSRFHHMTGFHGPRSSCIKRGNQLKVMTRLEDVSTNRLAHTHTHTHTHLSYVLRAAAVPFMLTLAACGSSGAGAPDTSASDSNVGEISLAIATVPALVTCVEIVASDHEAIPGRARSLERLLVAGSIAEWDLGDHRTGLQRQLCADHRPDSLLELPTPNGLR